MRTLPVAMPMQRVKKVVTVGYGEHSGLAECHQIDGIDGIGTVPHAWSRLQSQHSQMPSVQQVQPTISPAWERPTNQSLPRLEMGRLLTFAACMSIKVQI